MKILGVSFGSRNGNNDTICRVALEEAQKLGAEVEFIHLLDWNIEHCTGCCACSVGLVTGKGNICTRKDDFAEFWNNHVLAADGILFVDPIFESGCSGLFKTVMDRVGPGHDMAMNIVGDQISKEAGGKGVDPRFLQQKVTSYIAIGGSDWGTRAEADHAMVSLSPGWRVIDNARFQWCKDILMQEDKLERTREIARNLVEAAKDIENAKPAKPGVCPHCGCNEFYIYPGTKNVVCDVCGLEGTLVEEDGAFKFVFNPADEHKAHDILSGKFLHVDDIKENEGRLAYLRTDETFKAIKKKYADMFPPVPAPGK